MATPVCIPNTNEECYKTILVQGFGHAAGETKLSSHTVTVGSKVTVDYTLYTALPDQEWIKCDSTLDRRVAMQFTVGSGNVVKILDQAVQTMTLGEKAVIECKNALSNVYGFGSKGSPPWIPTSPCRLKIDLELHQVIQPQPDPIAIRLERALDYKSKGNQYHQASNYTLALQAYQQGLQVLGDTWGATPSELPDMQLLMCQLQLNCMACHIKLLEYQQAYQVSTHIQPSLANEHGLLVKVLYRTSQALVGLHRYQDALDLLEHSLVQDTPLLQQQHASILKQMHSSLEKEKQVYRKMLFD